MTQPTHVHHFNPGADPARTPLVLLHGSGRNEHDLAPLTEELAPGSSILGFRGTVAIDGGYAFFHRFPDRTIDDADITARAFILADFIETILASHALTRAPIAIGFSTGAIMAAALLLTRPSLLAGAILSRLPHRSPMICQTVWMARRYWSLTVGWTGADRQETVLDWPNG